MVALRAFGIDEYGRGPETVTMLVGPNGSGKSNLLLDIAQRYRFHRNVTVICNTPHDRFSGLRRVRRISVGRTDQSPKMIVKRAVAQALEVGSEFYQISTILKHCGYQARFGFRVDRSERYGASYDDIIRALEDDTEKEFEVHEEIGNGEGLRRALAFFKRHDPERLIWIDVAGKVLEFSLAREFASVLAHESRLRAWDVIRGVSVYLEREDRQIIEIHQASSGQLALISSLLFMITNVGEHPIVIIDEPENSLHPNWQREYVEKVLAALSYRNATLIVATHAPLVVTGALADRPALVSVYEIREGTAQRLDLDNAKSPNSIEEILWRAFDVVTPANHFVSEQIVEQIARFEEKKISKHAVLEIIDQFDKESFDEKQKQFFNAVRQLVDKVEIARDGTPDDEFDGGVG